MLSSMLATPATARLSNPLKQLHTCYEYAKNNGYLVVGRYIDRAQSGTSDSRAEFQRMIADSDKHTFEGVLVINLTALPATAMTVPLTRQKLKKNGVRVISARGKHQR